ncbi:MAG: hypothetical protein KME17_17605 [Cyanosarcina radialis HA8281-LM2]|jgi:hypothetical protein|nr:hypothetical protein [Cyanosarcina radialis HA8281-LM2]
MTTAPPQGQLVLFDEIYPETKAIAVLRQEPAELEARGSLKFERGYDDLDYLVFSVLSLPSQHRVALIRHQHAPNPGTEICVVPNEPAVIEMLIETIRFLNLSTQDLSWIHPQYEMELSQKKWESIVQG